MIGALRDGLRWVLATVGVCLLGAAVTTTWCAREYQRTEARRLQAMAPATPSVPTGAAATRREARATGVVGNIEIPRVGLSAVVVEGVTARDLGRAVGHLPATAFPGEPGNVALAGHRDTYFRPLRKVVAGDRIRIRTPDGSFEYRVDSIFVVTPERVDVVQPTGHPALTLVTCYPFHWIGPAPRRWIVRASPLDRLSSAAP